MKLFIGLILISLVIVLPVHLAGKMVNAKRTGFGWCLLAIILACLFQSITQSIFFLGFLFTPFVTALAYAIVMQTTYLKGIGIAILQFALTIMIATLLVTFSFTSLNLWAFPF